MEAGPEDVQAFYRGQLPASLAKYSDAFGTYDNAGLFYIKGLEKEVLGIYVSGHPLDEYIRKTLSL